MYDINELLNEAYEMCDFAGVKYNPVTEIKVSGRMTSAWGNCSKQNGKYYIKIAKRLMENGSKEAIMNTLVHEVIHTVNGCMNHGDAWQSNAEKINKCYGLNIKRCTSSMEKGVETHHHYRSYKYAVKCPSCGHVWHYKNESDVVKHPSAYLCNSCNVHLKRLIVL